MIQRYKDLVMGDLSWNFSTSEFTCKCGCGYDNINLILVGVLQSMRSKIGPLVITSGCRCVEYNTIVGGMNNSAHLRGLAADISCNSSRKRYNIINLVMMAGVKRIGKYDTFIHIDLDANLPNPVMW